MPTQKKFEDFAAAAPELLEALIMIHRVMIQRDMQEDEQEVADAAWLAIRKARGE